MRRFRHGEDVDFVWRLHDHGWLVRYVADVVVTHRARSTWRGWWAQRARYGRSSSELAKRHGTRLAPFRADTWTLLTWTSVLVGKPMVGFRIIDAARDQLRERMLTTTDNADKVAGELVGRGMVRAGPLMARAVVRTFGVAVVLSRAASEAPSSRPVAVRGGHGLPLALGSTPTRRHPDRRRR